MKKILIFIPCYNCEKQVPRVLDKIDEKFYDYITEILIVNNISTDNTEKVVSDYIENSNKKIKMTLVTNSENYNLGGSHKVAFNYAIENGFDYVIVLHGDDQGNINDIYSILKNEEYLNYDCMLGSRFMKGSKLIGYSKFRTFGNKVYNFLFSMALPKKIKDLGSGLNMYSVEMLKNQFYIKFPDRLTFNYCMIMAAKSYKHKIKFFPITWSESDQVSNVKMTRQAFNVLSMLLKYFFARKKFLNKDLRTKEIENYSCRIIKKSKEENE
jgi:glycosyltransferase involved in cell wall biosynthesis